MIDNRIVGKTISTLRQRRGMTQQQLAAALNVSHQAVSKWENGAALPDVQTMIDITALFGITMEQLLNGQIPAPQPENTPATPEEHLRNIGNFVTGVIGDIGDTISRVFKPEDSEEPAEEYEPAVEQQEAETEETDAEKSPVDETKPEDKKEAEKPFSLDDLLKTAPFMSKQAVADMLDSIGKKLSPSEIAKFAPFVEGNYLEQLIRKCEQDMNWDALRRVAPFLKKEVVDNIARVIAMGEKQMPRVKSDIEKAFDDIGKGVNGAVQNVIRFGENIGKAFEELGSEGETPEIRLKALRMKAFERALTDGRWDWIEAHIDTLEDEDMKRRIADAALAADKQDWVRKNLPGFADTDMIGEAIESGDWGWLGDHIWKFDSETQQKVALAATNAENWQWLGTYAETMDLSTCVREIAEKARVSGARMLAVQLTKYDMDDEQAEETVMKALDADDYEYFELMTDSMKPEAMCRCCIHMAKIGHWDKAMEYAPRLGQSGLEWLMQVAIEEGEFDAIDRLDKLISDQIVHE